MTDQNSTVVCTFFSSSIAVSDAVPRLPTSGLSPWGVAVVLGSAYSPVSDAASPLSLAGVLPWGVAVVFGFVYSPVNSLFLLAGLAIIVCSE